MNRFILTMVVVLMTNLAFSQYTFKGKVVDVYDDPIIGALLQVENSTKTTETDFDGYFKLEHNEPELSVEVQFIGHVTKTVNLVANEDNNIVLEEMSNILSHCPPITYKILPVFVSGKYPITQTTISKTEREATNLGQDLPILLNQLPSVVTTSDAGAGVGYTGIRVRGSDATRVNVTINGIPLNDSESQGVFWVNMPDFSSSTGNITLVRGVGTSTNGAGSFGGSVHIATEYTSDEAFAEYNGSVGSFNTWKNNIKFGTGEKNGWSANGRLSKITSDGFIDRASSDLQGYFFQTQKEYGSGNVKFVTFAGHEKTYQAWYGATKQQMQENGRTYNPYTYENQIDNYQQKHYQLLLEQNLSSNFYLDAGLHYTKGKGYFEEFKDGEDLSDYGIAPVTVGSETITETDLVRRRWLDNDFYGLVASVEYDENDNNLIVGGAINNYKGGHFGEVIQGQFVPQERIGKNYYDNDGEKKDANIYAKYTRDIATTFGEVRPFIDLQFRNVNYDFVGLALDGSGNIQNLPQSVSHNFFNPKLGVSAEFSNFNAYLSYAKAQKEPNRNDYTDSPNTKLPTAETLNDYELGFNYTPHSNLSASINGYFMDYKDQLAVTGGVNDVGEYSRINIDDSYRAGVEFVGDIHFGSNNQFNLGINATVSSNKVKAFTETLDNYDAPYTPIQIEHKNTDLALSPNFVAGATLGYTTPNKLLSANLINKYVGKQYLDNTSNENRTIDSFFTNNFSASVNLGHFIPTVQKVKFNLLVNNILNEKFESNGYTFGYKSGGNNVYESYYYPQAGTNFLTGLTVRF